MIKPIEPSPLNTSKKLYYECEDCGEKGTIFLENSMINVDNDGNPTEPMDDYDCPKCGKSL